MGTKSKNVNKYLTDLKELSAETKIEDAQNDFKPKVEELSDDKNVKKEIKKDIEKPAKTKKDDIVTEDKKPTDTNSGLDVSSSDLDELDQKAYTSKDIILGIINLLSIAFLVFLLIKLPEKAIEIKTLRLENVKYSESTSTIPISEDNVKKADEIEKLFLDDFGVYNFTNEIEKLRESNPAIQKVTFPSQKAVQDRLSLNGIPVVIVMQGGWESIGQAMSAIESLPFLFRPVSIRSQVSEEDASVIILNYGAMLYVGTEFTKN